MRADPCYKGGSAACAGEKGYGGGGGFFLAIGYGQIQSWRQDIRPYVPVAVSSPGFVRERLMTAEIGSPLSEVASRQSTQQAEVRLKIWCFHWMRQPGGRLQRRLLSLLPPACLRCFNPPPGSSTFHPYTKSA